MTQPTRPDVEEAAECFGYRYLHDQKHACRLCIDSVIHTNKVQANELNYRYKQIQELESRLTQAIELVKKQREIIEAAIKLHQGNSDLTPIFPEAQAVLSHPLPDWMGLK